MDTIELKNRIKNYIDYADERMLRIINAIIESQSEGELTKEHQEILDERLKFHKENPTDGKSWGEIKNSLKQQYDL